MPLFNFVCECGAKVRKILTPEQAKRGWLCVQCGQEMDREAKAPTTAVKESLDNGSMSRTVERFSNAEELYRERARSKPE